MCPAGARRVLRDARVQAAVLETARGGILRRGLAVARADVAGLTAFGEFLHFQGIPFVIDERGDAVVFSCDRLSEWWASETEAA